jgi:hypothetical protein
VKRAGPVALILVLVLGAVFLVDSYWLPGPDSRPPSFVGDTPSFPPPRWLSAEHDGKAVQLSWHSVPGALAYTLWRSPRAEGDFQVIHRGRDTLFVDRSDLSPGQTWCYLLTATDPEFDESPFSDSRCVQSIP